MTGEVKGQRSALVPMVTVLVLGPSNEQVFAGLPAGPSTPTRNRPGTGEPRLRPWFPDSFSREGGLPLKLCLCVSQSSRLLSQTTECTVGPLAGWTGHSPREETRELCLRGPHPGLQGTRGPLPCGQPSGLWKQEEHVCK